jgi:formylglycine-generating enzyme required for sulfatase activity
VGRQAALIALALCAGCARPDFGELLVHVETDVGVPTFASRLRLDLYTDDGGWYESREITVDDPAAWPLSFGLYTDDPAGKRARVRLRLYPDGAVRDYRGEQAPGPPPFAPPMSAPSLDALCTQAPLLPASTDLTQRRGGVAITQHLPTTACPYMSGAGSVAARVQIPATNTYRFEVVRALPDGSHGVIAGDTIVYLRRDCADPSSQIDCADDIDTFEENLLSRLVTPLDPGTYTIITGGKPEASPADLTLRWAPASQWIQSVPATPAMPTPALPRLVIDGTDATPSTEPEPARSIDRLLEVTIPFGSTRRVRVRLAGECLGTAADLANDASCVDTAGLRVAFDPATLDARGEAKPGTWVAQQSSPCAAGPRDGDPTTLDGQVCVPGGAFTLGTDEISGIGMDDPAPRQVAVIAPFLIDRNEVTVARYRKALGDGYTPPSDADFDQVVNNGALARSDPARGCTWNGDASGPAIGVDREHHPLNCISWRNARALCQFFGGDLPTHAQWEYAAVAAGRVAQTRYPWGNDDPGCDRTVFGNAAGGGCSSGEPGPKAVDAEPWADGDRTPLGILGLGGNVSEWALDSFRPYRDACWWQHALREVGCSEPEPVERSIRGGSWLDLPQGMLTALILGQAPEFPDSTMGLRCAYPAGP